MTQVSAPNWLDVITALGTIVAILAVTIPAYRKWVRPWRQRRHANKVALEVTLMGRDEIRDPETGRVLSPAVPALGVRLGTMESAFQRMSDAFVTLSSTHQLIVDVSARVDAHDTRIGALERATMERIATRAENAAAMNMVERLHAESNPSSVGPEVSPDAED